MRKKIERFLSRNYILIAILSLAAFLRLYRINDYLGFWYDQGRDALVIWDFIHKGKFFLIGPTTGIEGVFRGPWYYWLIAPFYWVGNGNPLYPSIFLILTTVFAIFVLYKTGEDLGGKRVAVLSAFFATCSIYIIGISRWLSNPTPMLLIGISLVWAVFKFFDKKTWALPLIAFLVGMALQFGSATEYFYLPILLIIFIWKRKILPEFKVWLKSGAIFFLAFVPQILFELRHPGVLSGPIMNFLLHGKSSDLSLRDLVASRLNFFYRLLASKFWINGDNIFAPFFIAVSGYLAVMWRGLIKNGRFVIILLFSVTPFLGMLFFNGNSGNVYDYYFTGYFMVWILLFSFILVQFSKGTAGKIVLVIFLTVFVYKNFSAYIKEYSVSLQNPKIIAFSNQIRAINWIYSDSNGKDFNVDEYVPPVIPYAYQYLFQWFGATSYNRFPAENQIGLLYTLHEADPDHPDRISSWLDRQDKIGKILETKTFGGIVVERRERIDAK